MTVTKPATDFDHFLPNFCNIRILLGVILVSQFLAFLLQLASGPAEHGFWSELGLKSLFILWVALLNTAILCRIRSFLQTCTNALSGFIAFCIIQSITLLISWLSKDLLPEYGLLIVSSNMESDSAYYLRNTGISCLIGVVLLHYLHMTHEKNLQIKAESEARMITMQSRIRPHFLFNSLNTIASLTRINPSLAEELIQDLAELFRAVLKADRKLVTLGEELHLAEQYLNIELQRLNKRLKVEWDLPDIPRDTQIPPLILQPLIENAVNHGIEPSVNGGTIWIKGDFKKNKVSLTVQNTISEDRAKKARQGNRMAIDNIRTRLQTCFPEEGKLFISSFDDCYQVRIVFPYFKESP